MASPSPKYEPLPRFGHISGCVGSKLVVQGGRTKDFSEKRKQHLSSVVEIFDPYSELWEQRQVQGVAPSPGTYGAASASLHDDLFSFGGYDGRQVFNTIHTLDSKTCRWSQVSPQNADGAPMPKDGCGMIAFRNSLVVFGGYGVPRGPTKPGSFIKSTRATDGSGWTNEFHFCNISDDVWSCPATTGKRPPPCAGLTFTAVDDRKAVVFGGHNKEQGHMNDVYIIDLSTMNWSKLIKSDDWPAERSDHAACCLNYGQQFPQLLVTGGLDRRGRPLGDVWILDIERGKWRKESSSLKARWKHSLTAFSLGPGLTEVVEFGGTSEPPIGYTDATQPIRADSTLLQFRRGSGESQWELLSVVDNKQRGSQTRIIEKFRYTEESWQQSTQEGEMTRMERQQLQRERDRARDEKREIERERDRAREEKCVIEGEKDRAREVMERERDRAREEKREMERERDRAREEKWGMERERDRAREVMERERDRESEKVRELEGERERERMEKMEMKAKVWELKKQRDQTKVKERAMEARTWQAEEGMKLFQEERDRTVVEKMQIVQHAEALSREAQNKIMELVAETERAEQKRNEIQLELDVLLYEKEGEQERTRKEREKAAIEAQRAEQEIVMLKQRAITLEAQKEDYKNRLHMERNNFKLEVTILEKQMDDVRMAMREVERAKEIFRQRNIEAEAEIGKLRRRIEEKTKRERDRASSETQKVKEKEFQERVKELKKENNKTIEEKCKAESERDKERLRRQEVEGRLRKLESKRDNQESIAENVQCTEPETGRGAEEQELEAPKKAEIRQLKQRLHEQATESEEKAKSLEREMERIQVENREIADEVVKETKVRFMELEGERDRERKRARELEGERERERAEKERVRVELEQAQTRANQLQQRLDEVERREHEVLQEQEEQGSLEEDESKQRETQVIAERTVQVTNEKQDIVWERYGLRLHIPPNSLPEDCPKLTLHMTVSKANDYKLPAEDGIVVSAVYSFSHSLGDRKLRQPVTLQMQHCVVSGSYSPLCIVHSSEMSPPYQFHILEGGKFDGSDGYASIKLDHFCSFAVYLRWFLSSLIWTLKPCAVLYYANISKDKFHFLLYIVPRLDALLEEIKLDVKNNCDSFKWGTLSPFAFDEEKSFVCLKLPKDTVSGWKLSHINSDMMETEDIVRMRWEVHPIPFHVEVSWTGGEPIKKLTYKIKGAREHKITVTSPSECETIGSATPNSVTPEAFAGLPPPKLADLMNIVGVHVQADWKSVGDGLGLEAATLSTIHSDYSRDGSSSCMREVFIKWNEKMKENSWKKLAQIVSSETVNKAGLLPDMLDKIKKLHAQ